MTKNKVLILEDSEEKLSSLRGMLPGGKFVVVEARDGKTALDAIKKEVGNLRLLVIKFNLPKISGWKILKKAQDHPKLQSIPMVLTAEANDPIAETLPAADRFEIIVHPFNRKQFQNAMKAAIAKAKAPPKPTSSPTPPPSAAKAKTKPAPPPAAAKVSPPPPSAAKAKTKPAPPPVAAKVSPPPPSAAKAKTKP
ncbi:MAG: response regulator, partial [Cyanobacteria bacterium SBLK]|nr:response regulator [Cyanobacteria bacterium SBLK]